MRALIVGGLGFFGSHVVEKLSRENYEIGILDDRSSGSAGNVRCKTRQFALRADDRRCLEVMRNFKADCVVHCAWLARGADADARDATGLNGLDNLLHGCVASGVKRFLLIASHDGSEREKHIQRLAEQVCDAYRNTRELQIGVFHITRLYGPRMAQSGSGGILLEWIQDAEREASGAGSRSADVRLYKREPADQPADWLYVSDAAEAVFRFVEGSGCGTYDLSSNKAYTRGQIIAQIGRVRTWLLQEENWPDSEDPELFHKQISEPEHVQGLCNDAIRHDLDWIPLRGLSEGLLPTLRWYEARQRARKADSTQAAALPHAGWSSQHPTPKGWRSFFRTVLPFGENLLAFGLVLLLEYALQQRLGIRNIDVKVIYIVLVSALFGMRQSLFAVFLSTLAYMVGEMMSGLDLVSLVLDASLVVQLIAYALASLAVDIVVDARNRKIATLEEERVIQSDRFDFLQDMYTDTARIKNELQQQIIRADDSLGRIQMVMRELDGTDVQGVRQKVLGVMSTILGHNRMALYTMGEGGRYFRCLYKSADAGFEPEKSYRVELLGPALRVLEQGGVHVNRELNPELPGMMAPVLEGTTLMGMVALYDIGFDRMTLYFQNLLRIVTEMAADALVRAYRYEALAGPGRYWEDTAWLAQDAFAHAMENQQEAVNQGLSTGVLLHLGFPDATGMSDTANEGERERWLHKNGPVLSGMLREADHMGLDALGMPVVLLSNASLKDAERAMLRIAHAGLKVMAMYTMKAEVAA